MNLIQLKEHLELISEKAIEEWLEDNPPEKIKKDIKAQLEGARSKILFSMLGFQIHGREVYFPYRSDRQANPLITQLIEKNVEAALTDFIAKHAVNLLPDIERKCMNSFAEEYSRDFNRQLSTLIGRSARDAAIEARTTVQDLINKMIEDTV